MIEGKPDIMAVMEREGIELKCRGRDFWALSPFREEKTPSFKVNAEKQRWYDFGENSGGDVIDLEMKLKGFSFKDACKYLNIIPGKPAPIDPAKEKRKQQLKEFEHWRVEYYCGLCDELININYLKICAQRKKTLPEYLAFWLAEQLGKIPLIEHTLDILSGKDNDLKFELYIEATNE
jgi:hypothetical protein